MSTPTELSRQFRAEQIAIANRAAKRLALVFGALDFTNIDGTSARWMTEVQTVTGAAYAESAALGAAVYSDYRAASGVKGTVAVEQPLLDRSALQGALILTGPYAAKSGMGSGVRIPQLAASVFTNSSGAAIRDALGGGRNTVETTAVRDSVCVGYQRITSANPCNFCAMVSANTYRSLESASTSSGTRKRSANPQPAKSKYHAHCRCTVVPIYNLSSWPAGSKPQASNYNDLWQVEAAKGGSEQEIRNRFFAAYDAKFKTS